MTTRDEWLLERRKGLGASDAAAICGLSAFKSPLQVYLEKHGLWQEPESPSMAWGLKLEEVIAEAYQETTGRAVGRRIEGLIDRHPEHPWLCCSLDRVCEDRILELKTARSGHDWGEPGTDAVPREYLIQVQHQMFVTGDKLADIAVLISGSDFRVYTVQANEGLQRSLFAILNGFWWNHVLPAQPPAADWEDPKTPALIQALNQPIEGVVKDLGFDAQTLVDADLEWAAVAKSAERERQACRAHLAQLMGDANIGHLPDGREVVRKVIERKEYVVKATTYVDMRIRKGKA